VSGIQNADFLYEEKLLLQEVKIFVFEMILGSRSATDAGLEIGSLSLRFCFLKHLCFSTEPIRKKSWGNLREVGFLPDVL
jgi:hypothetical protein